MKNKMILLLILLAVIFSSCSVETKNELNNENHVENTTEEKNNIEDSEVIEVEKNTQEEIIKNIDFQLTLENIIDRIKKESKINEDIVLSDIKKIEDTFYVVVKVNNAEVIDYYYMLWKYNSSLELLLQGKVIEILDAGNYYYVNYRENLDDNSKIIKFNHNDESYEKVIYEGKTLNFSFSPNNKYMFIQDYHQLDNNEIIVLNEEYEIVFKSMLYNNAENVYDQHPVEVKFIKWTKDNKKLWVATGWNAYVMTFHMIDIENSTLKTYFTGETYGITEIELSPDNGCIVYSTKPEFYESGAYDEFHSNQTAVYLYYLNLLTDEKVEISTSVTRGFRPKWISNKAIEYNDPNGFMRLTFNIDEYNLNKDNIITEKNEELWQDVVERTPYINDEDGKWYYNETTYEIKLKIPSIYHLDSPGVYFYQRKNDVTGCYINFSNFIYELNKNITFIENVEKIYTLNNSYINENLFNNGIIEEGITVNGYKYAYFIDDVSDNSNGRVLSYIFVQLDDDIICKLEYRLFTEDFDKFDAEVIVNSITHTLTTGLLRDELLNIYIDNDTVKQVNFKVPYFYVQNYRGVKYYEPMEKEGLFCYLDYWIDNNEKFTVYINDGETAINYIGNIVEGYTKNGYKYSYYIEEKENYYHNPKTNMSEDVLVLISNIAVRLNENSVLKMKYELTEKDYSLFDINEILDSIILK